MLLCYHMVVPVRDHLDSSSVWSPMDKTLCFFFRLQCWI